MINPINEKKNELLKIWTSFENNDKLYKDNVRDEIMANIKRLIKDIHPYKITAPSGKNGRWQTYYKPDGGKRQIIRAQTEKELIRKLVDFYCLDPHLENMTFHSLYAEWLEYKKTVTDSPNTIKRHEQHYRKYFETSPLHCKAIKAIDELFLEQECNTIVKGKQEPLTRKEWGNIQTILNGMFKYAVKKKYLNENPMEKVEIHVKFKQIVKKTGKTETYNTDELKELNQYLDRKYTETEDSAYLAIRLNFMLGLRVGELVALKWADYTDLNHLHIVREEIRNQDTNTFEVVEHTKTNRDRFVVLVPKAVALLQKLDRTDGYIFTRNGERITSRQIAYILEKYAGTKGIATKSSHKMRKTFASNLNAAGVPVDCIRELLGHASLNTTLGYIYNPLTERETFERIKAAL